LANLSFDSNEQLRASHFSFNPPPLVNMPKKGSRRKKTRTHVKPTEASADPTASKVPKSFVVKSGTVGGSVAALVRDVRKVLEPNTGSRIRVSQSTVPAPLNQLFFFLKISKKNKSWFGD
jgi:hypothetical protein